MEQFVCGHPQQSWQFRWVERQLEGELAADAWVVARRAPNGELTNAISGDPDREPGLGILESGFTSKLLEGGDPMSSLGMVVTPRAYPGNASLWVGICNGSDQLRVVHLALAAQVNASCVSRLALQTSFGPSLCAFRPSSRPSSVATSS
ncbi:MAG: hypothetical protein HYZ29_01060 [Myxococcales bacterium]|nr:hypothetical protein [Myxococcales bacterium]